MVKELNQRRLVALPSVVAVAAVLVPTATGAVPRPGTAGQNGPIFFEAASPNEVGTDVFRINADGTGMVNLTRDLPSAGSPFVNHDGSRIYFVVSADPLHPENTKASSIWVMRPNGTGKLRLPLTDGASFPSVAGTTLLYTRCDLLTLTCRPYLANLNGTGSRPFESPQTEVQRPVIAPDGQRVLALTRPIAPPPNTVPSALQVLSLTGAPAVTVGSQLSEGPFPRFWSESPVWSRDGAAIVSVVGFPEYAPYLIAPDGSGIERLPWNGGQLQSVALSPDGKELAAQAYADFLSENPTGELRVIGLDGTGDRILRTGKFESVGNRVSWSVATPPLPPPPPAPDGIVQSIAPGLRGDTVVVTVATRRGQLVLAQGFAKMGLSTAASAPRLALTPVGRRLVRSAPGKLVRVRLVLKAKTAKDRSTLRALIRSSGARLDVRVAFLTKKGGEKFRTRVLTIRKKP